MIARAVRSLKSPIPMLACALAAVACAGSGHGVDGEVTAPGMPAHITANEVSFVGGKGTSTVTIIDSATARYTVTYCEDSPGGASCAQTTQQTTGSVLPAIRDKLFTDAQSPAFRALHAKYRPSSSVRAPDYQAVTVTITASERSRQIVWESGASSPFVLTAFLCSVRVARGDLIICYGLDSRAPRRP